MMKGKLFYRTTFIFFWIINFSAVFAQHSPMNMPDFETAKSTFPDFKVISSVEYQRIVEFRNQQLDNGATVHSFSTQDGQFCRCVDVFTQNSVINQGISPEEIHFEPLCPPEDSPPRSDATHLKPIHQEILDGSLDRDGRIRRCPENSFPLLVPSLETLCRFSRLDEYFSKYPEEKPAGIPGRKGDQITSMATDESRSRPAEKHLYAVTYSAVNNAGAGSDLNLWSPSVESNDEFSLSQIWTASGSGSDMETVEAGWQVYEQHYGDNRARFFIFYTNNNYTQLGDNLGCYNLDCVGFIQTSPDVALGGSFSTYSTNGGTQYYITTEYYRDPSTGHWWLRVGGSAWIGYYPNTLFDAQGLKNGADFVEYGGEIVDNNDGAKSKTDMGSGKFPDSGFGYAAFQSRLHYFTAAAYIEMADTAMTISDRSLYDAKRFSSSDSNWRQYLYFGGPGSSDEAPSLELYYDSHSPTQCFSAGDPFDGRYRIVNTNSGEYKLDLYIVLQYLNNFFFWPNWGRNMTSNQLTVPGNGETSDGFMQFFWPGETGTISGFTFWGVMTEPSTYNVVGNVAKLPLCGLGSGDVSFQLDWSYSGGGEGPDIDLHVVNPNGYHIYYGNRSSPDGGSLDFDDRGACGDGDGSGPENIFWQNGSAPSGLYQYSIVWFADCGNYNSVNFTVIIRKNGIESERKTGTLTKGNSVSYNYIY